MCIRDSSKGASLKSLQETGSAIMLSALTSLAGYTSLNIAHHTGMNSIATVVELGIITCTVCALYMLPALFEIRKRKFSLFQVERLCSSLLWFNILKIILRSTLYKFKETVFW